MLFDGGDFLLLTEEVSTGSSGLGTSIGTSTVNGVGSSIADGVGSSSGVSVVSGVGITAIVGIGFNSIGTAIITGIGEIGYKGEANGISTVVGISSYTSLPPWKELSSSPGLWKELGSYRSGTGYGEGGYGDGGYGDDAQSEEWATLTTSGGASWKSVR